MKQLIKIPFLAILFAVSACSQTTEYKSMLDEAAPLENSNRDMSQTVPEKLDIERKIIKEGEISFHTGNALQTRELVVSSVKQLDGYIAQDNIFNYDNRTEHRLVIRIPAKMFDMLLQKISESAGRIDSKNINTRDVTTEFIDLDARLQTKKTLEIRYKEILKQAHSVSEILEIEREIGILRSDIESMEGQLKYLQDRVSLSTLTVTFYEKTGTDFGFFSRFGEAFYNGWDNLLAFFIGLMNLWPFALLMAIAFPIFRRIRKNRKTKAQ
jgi:uncharacterized small protein (DUF1192 family)